MEYAITLIERDVKGHAVKIFTKDSEGNESEIVLSATFCHLCIDDLATEFSEFMKTKGHDITQEKP